MSEQSSRLQSDNPSALPPGTRLGEFELLSLLGVGGFGIVYLAFDHALEREVAVKEYMPAALAGRTETMHVSLRSQSDAEVFALGLKSFVNEARLLARFDHPALLKVHRFWEANGTAYMAMPVLRGRTVRDIRKEMAGPPDEGWLRSILMPLLGAIEKLHSEGVYHRDIAPDNIQIEPDGHPVLLDFGAARRVLSDKTQTLTAILKPAYAPIEQYAEAGSVKQGPWTDIYSLGATLHYLLLKRPPAPATARAVHDDASALTTELLPDCSEGFLRTVDWMLAPRPVDRPQSVAALLEVLEGRAAPPLRRAPAEMPVTDWDRTVMLPPRAPPAAAPASSIAPAAVGRDEATIVMPPRGAPAPQPRANSASGNRLPNVSSTGGRSPTRPVAIGLCALALAIAVGAMALWPRKQAPLPEAASVPPEAAAVVATAPSAVVTPAPAPLPASAVAESTVATVTVAAAARPAVNALAPEASTLAAQATEPVRLAHAGTLPAPRPASAQRPRPPAPVVAPTGAATVTPVAAAAAPQPDAQRPRVDSTPATVAAPPQVVATDTPKPPASPEASCAGRNPFSRFACMTKECSKREQANHPQCLEWFKQARADR